MNQPCIVCSHLHQGMIEELLWSPLKIERIALFYELDIKDLEYHKNNCMENHL